MQYTKPFVADVKQLRERAQQHIQEGAVTPGYKGDRETVIEVLNEALATEIVCVLRYKRHQYMARGIHAQSVATEFADHAAVEQQHMDKIAERIVQLGGAPNYHPEGLATRSHSQYAEGVTLEDMIREDLIAERIVIDSYGDIIRYLGNDDPTTRVLMEGLLRDEEEHAEDLASLLQDIGRRTM